MTLSLQNDNYKKSLLLGIKVLDLIRGFIIKYYSIANAR